jgi:CheY-like chemotaxis protein
MPNTDPPTSQRILLVEDNFLVAASLKQMLEDCGCEVLGPIPSLQESLTAAERDDLDGAVLDINIIGGTSIPVAERLRGRGCPILFITGYGSPRVLPEPLLSVPRLNKPIAIEQLAQALREVMDD